VLPLVLVAVGSLLAFLAVLALWINRQVVNTDNWTNTSSALLEDRVIRDQVATYLVDSLYANVDVESELRAALPPRLDPLAGTAAGALRDFAEKATRKVLAKPRTQQLWEDANRTAHTQLLNVLEGGGSTVSTQGGVVVLNTRALLTEVAQQVGIGAKLRDRIPASAAQITIMRSDQLKLAQDGLQVLRALPWVLVGLALALFALAIVLAREWRRKALRAIGFGLALAGGAAFAAHTMIGEAVVSSLASTAAIRPAIADAWTISTTFLVEAAGATVLYGIGIIICAWLAGPSRPAVWLRRVLAPYATSAWLAYAALAVVVLGIVWWGPTPATRRPLGLLIIAILLAVGMEFLRRQMRREFPDATLESAARRRRELQDRARDWITSATAGIRQPSRSRTVVSQAPDARLERLEQLARLRDAGVLDANEFEREKQRALRAEADGVTPAVG
jgi:hypothetical protein